MVIKFGMGISSLCYKFQPVCKGHIPQEIKAWAYRITDEPSNLKTEIITGLKILRNNARKKMDSCFMYAQEYFAHLIEA